MRIVCLLPNASLLISGVAFTPFQTGPHAGVISEEISEAVAEGFLSIPGYHPEDELPEVEGAAPAPAPAAPAPAPKPPAPAPASKPAKAPATTKKAKPKEKPATPAAAPADAAPGAAPGAGEGAAAGEGEKSTTETPAAVGAGEQQPAAEGNQGEGAEEDPSTVF